MADGATPNPMVDQPQADDGMMMVDHNEEAAEEEEEEEVDFFDQEPSKSEKMEVSTNSVCDKFCAYELVGIVLEQFQKCQIPR